MTGENRTGPGDAVRALASPITVAALVVLVINDHLLKAAWPGLVTGKLSDFAGLVVAPPLLALALCLVRVRRAAEVALVTTGIGFVLTKATATGAHVASDAWSFVAGTSVVLRDPTDLVALPALGLAALALRRASVPGPELRRRVTALVGAAVLPVAMLATAATSCSPPPGPGSTAVGLVNGRWDGPEPRPRTRLVAGGSYGSATASLDAQGRWHRITPSEEYRLTDTGPQLSQVCDPAEPDRCWRIASAERPTIEATADRGRTWAIEYTMTKAEASAIIEEEGESCGESAALSLDDLALLEGRDGPLVVASATSAGLLIRDPGGSWQRTTDDDLLREKQDPSPAPDQQLTPIEPTPSPTGSPTVGPGETPPVPTPTCASPSTVTVTPNPQNGPPTSDERCDIASGT